MCVCENRSWFDSDIFFLSSWWGKTVMKEREIRLKTWFSNCPVCKMATVCDYICVDNLFMMPLIGHKITNHRLNICLPFMFLKFWFVHFSETSIGLLALLNIFLYQSLIYFFGQFSGLNSSLCKNKTNTYGHKDNTSL